MGLINYFKEKRKEYEEYKDKKRNRKLKNLKKNQKILKEEVKLEGLRNKREEYKNKTSSNPFSGFFDTSPMMKSDENKEEEDNFFSVDINI